MTDVNTMVERLEGKSRECISAGRKETGILLSEAAALIRSLTDTNRKLHRRAQSAEAPALSIKAYKEMLMEVFCDHISNPEKIEATIEAYTAADGHSLKYHMDVAKHQIALRNSAERRAITTEAEVAVLREQLHAMRKLRNLHWRRAIDAERKAAHLREALERLIRNGQKQGWNDSYPDDMAFARAAGRREG